MTPLSYEAWLSLLRQRATERDLQWIVSAAADAHRQAFEQGLSPDEELAILADMAQWRGCGCGGGG